MTPATGNASRPNFTATRNACKLCTPLGACLAFRGVEGCVPLLHGSQGCATYIRRYMISHFKEPVDIASSSFGESAAIFGGGENLTAGLKNVIRQYKPQLVGVASTCLAETIGDDMNLLMHEFRAQTRDLDLPEVVCVSTASYRGTHAEGFHDTVRALVESLAEPGEPEKTVNLLPGMLSPADLRHLKETFADFGLTPIVLPDYSDTLDGPIWNGYHQIPAGGTPVGAIRAAGRSRASIQMNETLPPERTAGGHLADAFKVPCRHIGLPIGVRRTDELMDILAELAGREIPTKYSARRGRLVDACVDGHKYVFEKRAIVYGEEDLVVAVCGFLAEIGVLPVLCVSGGNTGRLGENIRHAAPDLPAQPVVLSDSDFVDMEEAAMDLAADVLIGSSKGFKLARKLDKPLVRVGFPIHDRFGGSRILHVGYQGTQNLLDRVVNAIIEDRQAGSDVGYTYM